MVNGESGVTTTRPQRLGEIEQEIHAINRDRAENLKAFYESLREEGIDGDHSVSEMYEDVIIRLDRRLKELEDEKLSISYCPELVNLIGVELHDLYREQFPINANTLVQEIGLSYQLSRWAYPATVQRYTHSSDGPLPAIVPTLGVAEFQEWASGEIRVYLAYAPEINTVFVGRKERVLS